MKTELDKIKNQSNKSENKTEPISTLSNDYLSKGKRKRDNDDVDEKDDDKDNGLFILGVIERAAKEKKRTKSVVIK